VKATATLATLTGVEANDAPVLAGLMTTFEGGFATNQANLALVSFYVFEKGWCDVLTGGCRLRLIYE